MAKENASDMDDVDMSDAHNVNINAYINKINSWDAAMEAEVAKESEEEAEVEEQDEERSPPNKRKKKEKKKKSKDGEASILKKGRFSNEGVEAAKKKDREAKKR